MRVEVYVPPRHASPVIADEDTTAELEAVRQEIAGIRAEVDDLADQVGDGKVSPALAARSEPRMLERLRVAEVREQELGTPPALRDLMEPGDDVAQRWTAAPMSTKRRVARLLLSPAYLVELRVVRSPIRGHHVTIEDRVIWRTYDDGSDNHDPEVRARSRP